MIELHALSRPKHAKGDLSGTQNDNISSLLNQNIQRRPPHSHRGDRGLDLVGFLIRVSGYKAKSTQCQLDGDIAGFGVIKHRSIKFQSGVRPKGQVGVIAKHRSSHRCRPRCARLRCERLHLLSQFLWREAQAGKPCSEPPPQPQSARRPRVSLVGNPATPEVRESVNKARLVALRSILLSQLFGNAQNN